MAMRLGELLVAQGLLTEKQVERVLEEQGNSARPFGEIAERLFGLSERQIEEAWAEQYSQMAPTIDPSKEKPDAAVREVVTKRQAWQFRVMPIRREGREVVFVTTAENLPRAVRFVAWHMREPVYFVLATMKNMEAALRKTYPLPGANLAEVKGK